ncbi:MAG: glutaredoxin 3 [Acidobacteriota bacterium]
MKAPVLIYTMTLCPYCTAAKNLLKKKGVDFEEVNLDREPHRWEECERLSGRSTVPQVFAGGRHLGGAEDLQALDRSGELDRILSSLP